MKIDKWSKMANEQNKIPLFGRLWSSSVKKVFSLKDYENGHMMNNSQNSKFCWFSVPHLSLQKDEIVLLGPQYIDACSLIAKWTCKEPEIFENRQTVDKDVHITIRVSTLIVWTSASQGQSPYNV